MRQNNELLQSYHLLKWTYGLVPIVAGVDKFTNFLTDWTKYLSPYLKGILPISPGAFMGIAGVIEILAGLIVLSRFTRYGAGVVSAWLFLIALNLITVGYFDVAVRDVVMSIGALTLFKLSTAVNTVSEAANDVSYRVNKLRAFG